VNVPSLELYDTSLRDGAQDPRVSFSVSDKIKISKLLDNYVDVLEAGWPGSNEVDDSFFRKKCKLNAKIAAFGMTGKTPKDDLLDQLVKAEADIFTIVGKSWDVHARDVLGLSLKQNLKMIKNTIRYLTKQNKKVFFDAEHFFDGYKYNKIYAMNVLKIAIKSGADTLVLCDTRGSAFPEDVRMVVKSVKKRFNVRLGIHAHNDSGLALANTLAGVKAGCTQVQGTFLGIGERCGNVDFFQIIPALVRKGYITYNMKGFYKLGRKLRLITGVRISKNHPYIGDYAFAHKAGLHSDSMLKNAESYELINPKTVGNERLFPISNQTGRAGVVENLRRIGIETDKSDWRVKELVEKIKKTGFIGTAQFWLLASDFYTKRIELKLKNYCLAENLHGKPKLSLEVMLGDVVFKSSSYGNGPVNAFDNALRKILFKKFKSIDNLELVNYDTHPLGGERTTGAEIIIEIEFSSKKEKFNSIRTGTNITKTSFLGIVDAYKYYINKVVL
jgi:2-isopropylmalate synthase